MKPISPSLMAPVVVALTTLCPLGCELRDRTEGDDGSVRTNQAEHVERPGVADAADQKDQKEEPRAYEPGSDASKLAGPGGRDSAAGPDAPGVDERGSEALPGSSSRAEYVAASRRRLDALEHELGQLEVRSRERGTQLRGEIREEKKRLDRELERIDQESDEAWTQAKEGFADALGRLEVQIRQVRKDIDPDA